MSWFYTLFFTFICISGTLKADTLIKTSPSHIESNLNNTKNITVLNITVTTKAPYFKETDDGFLDLLLIEIGKRLDIKFNILKQIPPARALSKLNQGNTDGDFPRVSGLNAIYPSIIYVPEKIIDFKFVAFSHKECSSPISFDAIQNSKVGFIIGWKIYEQKTSSFSQLTKIVKPPQLFELLNRKRIQYGLHEHYIGHQFIADLQLKGKIHECTPALMIKPMFFYLNKRHSKLIPELTRILQQIKADGTYQQLAEKTLPINK